MGDFPLMTDTGTFVINGAERVIVSQLVLVHHPFISMKKSTKMVVKTILSCNYSKPWCMVRI